MLNLFQVCLIKFCKYDNVLLKDSDGEVHFRSVKMAGGKEDILKDTTQTTKQFMDMSMQNHIEK